MKKHLLILIVLVSVTSFGQQKLFEFKDSLKKKSTLFSVDNFQNIYTVNEDVIVKYNKQFDSLFSTSLKTIYPTSIESSKTFRSLIFDSERATVAFYDNTLTPINDNFSLTELDIIQGCLVAESFNGNSIWVLDEGNMQLLKVNNNLEIVLRIENLNHLFKDNFKAIQMFEYNDILAIHFKGSGVATFDVFGTFLKFYPLKSDWVYLKNNYLFSLKNNQLDVFEIPFMDLVNTQKLNFTGIDGFIFSQNQIVFHSASALYRYNIISSTNNK